jgi:AGCS family alanine or glycine:cation symporter
MNGLMAIPNLIGVLLLSGIVRQESRRYFSLAPGQDRQNSL